MSGDPHTLTLFSLKPLNERAEEVVAHPENNYLTSILSDGTVGIDIGFQIRSKTYGTLATLGRGRDADIFVGGSSISKIQCSFELVYSWPADPDRTAIMLWDRSNGQTTQVHGDTAVKFEHGRLRRVLVQEKLNNVIGMGGAGQDLVMFELEWRPNAAETVKSMKSSPENLRRRYAENPRLARTMDESETVLPSLRGTRMHTPGHGRQMMMRHAVISEIGCGEFATVYKTIGVDTGKLMAVKVLQRPKQVSRQRDWKTSVYMALKREVETLSKISHPHIVDYITSQGWDGQKVEIFMGLMKGSLGLLVQNREMQEVRDLADSVLRQMLQALDCLAANNIIHRDVKPDNILYTSAPSGEFIFALGDFGLCNHTMSAKTFAGTPIYMAPEFYRGEDQTHKADVWSLFVTMLWLLNVDDFREVSDKCSTVSDVQRAISNAVSKVDVIEEMARVNPKERATAAQMLVKCFNAKGLTTSLRSIPALPWSNVGSKQAIKAIGRATVPDRITELPPTNIVSKPAVYITEVARAKNEYEFLAKLPRVTPQGVQRRQNAPKSKGNILRGKPRYVLGKHEIAAIRKHSIEEYRLPGQFPQSNSDS